MIEEWRPIAVRPIYEVSSLGNIRSWAKSGPHGGRASSPHDLRTVVRKSGYVRAYFGFKGITRDVHRLVALAFLGPPPTSKHEVAHKNGVRSDNRAENLEWKTRSENHADKRTHGTYGRTLTEKTAAAIRAAYVPGITTQSEVAARFGVTQSTVSKLHLNQTWRTGVD